MRGEPQETQNRKHAKSNHLTVAQLTEIYCNPNSTVEITVTDGFRDCVLFMAPLPTTFTGSEPARTQRRPKKTKPSEIDDTSPRNPIIGHASLLMNL